MAFTIRLSEEQTEALRAIAKKENRSMQGVMKNLLDERIAASDRAEHDRTIAALNRVTERDAVALDLLSR